MPPNPQSQQEWTQYAMQLAADGQLSMQESEELATLIQSRPDLMNMLNQFRASNPEQYQYLIDYAPAILAQYPTLQPLWNVLPGYIPPIDPGSTPAPTVPPLEPNEGARAALMRTLQEFGLESLGEWVWEQYLDGVPLDQIFLDMRERPEYQARFPAIKELAEKGRAMSEAEYISYEKQAAATMRQFGLPQGFYDQPDDFAAFLRNEVSVAELQSRVQLASNAAFTAASEVREELAALYGIGHGDLVAYWLDPDRAQPILEQRFTSAQISGSARTTGYGPLSLGEAERLASLGVDQGQAQQGFAQLSSLGEVFRSLNRGETEIGRESQLGAQFAGEAGAQRAIERRQRRRVGEFEAGGGFSSSERGFTGVGAART